MASLSEVAGWQLSIRFDGERDHHWHFKRSRCAHDPDRLFHIIHRNRRHQVGRGAAEGADLRTVILLRLLHRHRLGGHITISTRPDAAANYHGRLLRLKFFPNFTEQVDRLAVCFGQCFGAVAEFRGPVGVCAPSGAFQNKPRFIALRQCA